MPSDVPSNITSGKYVRQIVVSAPGPQGPAGLSGVQNDEVVGLVSYRHQQGAVSNLWSINHNLNFHPNVTIYDSGGSMVEGTVNHINAVSLTVSFSDPISGVAYLS